LSLTLKKAKADKDDMFFNVSVKLHSGPDLLCRQGRLVKSEKGSGKRYMFMRSIP